MNFIQIYNSKFPTNIYIFSLYTIPAKKSERKGKRKNRRFEQISSHIFFFKPNRNQKRSVPNFSSTSNKGESNRGIVDCILAVDYTRVTLPPPLPIAKDISA